MKKPSDDSGTSVSGIRTILIEDSPRIRDSLKGTLEDLTPVRIIDWAETEREAIDKLAQTHRKNWDLAIIDLALKDGNGLQVISAIADRTDTQKIVVLSNYIKGGVKTQCLSLGADAVFDKSHDIDDLINFCRQLSPDPGSTSLAD